MGKLRSSVMALVAVSVLVGALFVLVPKEAGATQIFMGSVENFKASTSPAGFAFDISASVKIDAGEHIPIDYAEVLMLTAGTAITFGTDDGVAGNDGMITTSPLCEFKTTNTVGGAGSGTAQIVSISGANLEFAPFVGYGYTPAAADAYGYTYIDHNNYASGQGAKDFTGYNGGTGYGYGYLASPVTLQVVIHVAGCTNIDFAGASFKQFLFQVGIGGDATHLFASVPATTFLANPAPVDRSGAAQAVTSFAVTAASQSGDFNIVTFVLADPDGGNNNLLAGSLVAGTLTGNLQNPITFTLKLERDLPSGTIIQISVQDQATSGSATQSLANAPFGITTSALSSRTTLPAGIYFQITISPPNGQFVSAGDTASNTIDLVDFTLTLPAAYFTATGITLGASMSLLEISADGTQTMIGPSSIVVNGAISATYKYQITSFSSFAMISGNVGGGGGGGGGAPVVTATSTATGTSTITGTSTATSTGTSTGTATDTSTGTDGTGTGTGSGNGGGAGGLNPWIVGGVLVGALAIVGSFFLLRRKA